MADGRTDGYMKIMPLVAPTPQLKLKWTDLSWSVGAECGNHEVKSQTGKLNDNTKNHNEVV